jgi:hypothetical protein
MLFGYHILHGRVSFKLHSWSTKPSKHPSRHRWYMMAVCGPLQRARCVYAPTLFVSLFQRPLLRCFKCLDLGDIAGGVARSRYRRLKALCKTDSEADRGVGPMKARGSDPGGNVCVGHLAGQPDARRTAGRDIATHDDRQANGQSVQTPPSTIAAPRVPARDRLAPALAETCQRKSVPIGHRNSRGGAP